MTRIIEVACNAHARRKFCEARGSDAARSHQALAYYAQLYEIERHAKDKEEAQRLQMRQDLAVPILNQFQTWLDGQGADPSRESDLVDRDRARLYPAKRVKRERCNLSQEKPVSAK